MKRKILFVLPLSWVLVSCAPALVATPGACHIASIIPAKCHDPAHRNDPKVTFNTITLKANPPNVCAEPGSTLEISIVPPAKNKVGSVAVSAKDPLDSWLAGTNAPDKGKIKILIPEWVTYDDYDYGFTTFDGKCLDPRVNVDH